MPIEDLTTGESKRLPLQLVSQRGLQLIQDLKQLQAYLSDRPELTHNQLFDLMQPLIYRHYAAINQRFVNPLETFASLTAKNELTLEQTLILNNRLSDGRILFKALREEKTSHRAANKKTQLPRQEAQALIHTLDLTAYPLEIQGALLDVAGRFSQEVLADPHPSWKDQRLLSQFMNGAFPPFVIKTLKDLGFDLTAKLQEERSLLHEAILNRQQNEQRLIALVPAMMKQGLSLNALDVRGRSPLDLAMAQDLRQLFTFLVSQGAVKAHWQTALEFYTRLPREDITAYKAFKSLEKANLMIGWQQTLEMLLPVAGEGHKVKTATLRTRVLPTLLYNQLFDQKGILKKINHYGRRAVGKITHAGYGLYVKQYPEFPGTEQGVSNLMYRLTGRGAPYSELIRIHDIPYLISQEVPGLTLHDVLKMHPDWLTKLDSQSTSEMIVLAMLINPEDGKPDNYIVEPLASGQYRLVAIDNDHAFGVTVAKEQGHAAVQVKSILYCLDQMRLPIHPAIWDIFGTLDDAKVLKSWLRELSSINKCYGELFTAPEMKTLMNAKDHESFIGVAFTNPMLRRLYEKLVRLQTILKETQQAKVLTHLELLKRMEPVLGHRYGQGLEAHKKPGLVWERFMRVDGSAYASGKKNVPQLGEALTTTTSFKAYLTSLNIPLKEEILDVIREGRHIGPDTALLELVQIIENERRKLIGISPEEFNKLTETQRVDWLRHLNFKTMSIPQQQAWLEVLATQDDHRTLILKGCNALTDQHFFSQKPRGWFSLGSKIEMTPRLEIRHLRKLDLTECQNITDSLIPHIAGGAVGLEMLSLRELPKLTRMQEPLLFPVLQWLDVGGCSNLVMLHLKAPCLRILNADDCSGISFLELMTPQLKELDLRGMKLLNDKVLDQQIASWQKLKILKLEGCDQVHYQDIRQAFPLYPVKLLAEVSGELLRNKLFSLLRKGTLTELDLKENNIGAAGAADIAKVLETNSFLTILNLKSNQIGVTGAVDIAKALKNNSSLTELCLDGNQFRDAGAAAIAKALETNSFLTTLDMRSNQIGDAGAADTAKALETNSALLTLELWNNHIGDTGVAAIAKALETNSVLSTLKLWANNIGAAGAAAIAKALETNSTLTELNLHSNKIGDVGAAAIAKALETNSTLSELNLKYNKIGDVGAAAIAKALETNSVLATLHLSSNKIGDTGATAIAKVLETNSALTTLDLSSNEIEDAGATAIAKTLETNSVLTELNLMLNNIGAAGATAIAKALEVNSALTDLNLCRNKIGDAAKQLIDQILECNKKNHPSQASPQQIGSKLPGTLNPLKHAPFHAIFRKKPLRFTTNSIDPAKGFEMVTGIELDTGLEILLSRSSVLSPLLVSVFQSCFKTKRLPATLCTDSQSLYQQWQQDRTDTLSRNLGMKEVESKVQHTIEDQITIYYAQEHVFAAFLAHYLKQQDWLVPGQENLGLLDAIAQTTKVNICIWSSEMREDITLVHSFGPTTSRKTSHLLHEANRAFIQLTPLASPDMESEEKDAHDEAASESSFEAEVKERDYLATVNRRSLLVNKEDESFTDMVSRNRKD